jgi:hypothetical protein
MRDVAVRVGAAVAEAVAKACAEMVEKGWEFLGRAKVLATSFVKRARSLEKRRKLVPRVAARSMFLRVRMLDDSGVPPDVSRRAHGVARRGQGSRLPGMELGGCACFTA